MSRLPVPGSDAGSWGAILNDFLVQAHNSDGTLKSIDKSVVGLGNVNNTSDANKPVSVAVQTALDDKVSVVSGGGETYYDNGSVGATATIDLGNGNVQKVTLTTNCTVTLTGAVTGAYRALLLFVVQGGTGSYTVTWPGSVSWGNAGAPLLSTAVGKLDMVNFSTVDGGTVWYGVAGPQGF